MFSKLSRVVVAVMFVAVSAALNASVTIPYLRDTSFTQGLILQRSLGGQSDPLRCNTSYPGNSTGLICADQPVTWNAKNPSSTPTPLWFMFNGGSLGSLTDNFGLPATSAVDCSDQSNGCTLNAYVRDLRQASTGNPAKPPLLYAKQDASGIPLDINGYVPVDVATIACNPNSSPYARCVNGVTQSSYAVGRFGIDPVLVPSGWSIVPFSYQPSTGSPGLNASTTQGGVYQPLTYSSLIVPAQGGSITLTTNAFNEYYFRDIFGGNTLNQSYPNNLNNYVTGFYWFQADTTTNPLTTPPSYTSPAMLYYHNGTGTTTSVSDIGDAYMYANWEKWYQQPGWRHTYFAQYPIVSLEGVTSLKFNLNQALTINKYVPCDIAGVYGGSITDGCYQEAIGQSFVGLSFEIAAANNPVGYQWAYLHLSGVSEASGSDDPWNCAYQNYEDMDGSGDFSVGDIVPTDVNSTTYKVPLISSPPIYSNWVNPNRTVYEVADVVSGTDGTDPVTGKTYKRFWNCNGNGGNEMEVPLYKTNANLRTTFPNIGNAMATASTSTANSSYLSGLAELPLIDYHHAGFEPPSGLQSDIYPQPTYIFPGTYAQLTNPFQWTSDSSHIYLQPANTYSSSALNQTPSAGMSYDASGNKLGTIVNVSGNVSYDVDLIPYLQQLVIALKQSAVANWITNGCQQQPQPNPQLCTTNPTAISTNLADYKLRAVLLSQAEIASLSVYNTTYSGLSLNATFNNNDDADGDGIPSAWEDFYGYAPYPATATLDPQNATDAANLDVDGSGLTYLQEYQQGIAPNNTDINGDGISNSQDIALGINAISTSNAQLAAGGRHMCILDNAVVGAAQQQAVQCWGRNTEGQVSPLPTLTNPIQMASGLWHSCAIDNTGVKCWGLNNWLQAPANPVAAAANPKKIAAGDAHSCAIDNNGVECWGQNLYGQVSPSASMSGTLGTTQVQYPSGTNPFVSPTQLALGQAFSCAIDKWQVKCWGKMGSTTFTGVQTITSPALAYPSMIAAGTDFVCALDSGSVKCWGGANAYGQLNAPTNLQNPRWITAGNGHACALDNNGVTCWGDNTYGQSSVPVLSNPSQISAGLYYTCALDKTGVHCWGDNTFTQLNVPVLPMDRDHDGMPDWWEVRYGLNPLVNDANSDLDGDGFSNLTEYLRGTDPTNVSNARYDFSGDHYADVLLRNLTTGVWDLSQMNGLTVLNEGSESSALTNAGVVTVATADFNGDGKTDILTRCTATSSSCTPNTFHIDLINGSSVIGSTWLSTMSTNVSDVVMSTKDFNRDGKADVLLRNSTTGVWTINYMNGTNAPTIATLNASTDLCYTMHGDGDYDGNGYPDILLRKDAGGSCGTTSYPWIIDFTNGTPSILTSSTAPGVVVSTSWSAVVTDKDFNGDGKSDILVRYNTGSTRQWTLYNMNGTATVTGNTLNFAVSNTWQFASAGDFNNDGKADILLSSTTNNQLYIYLLNNTTILSSGALSSYLSPWGFMAVDDYNGDGKSDILVRNGSSGQWAMYLMNGLTVLPSGTTTINNGLSYVLQNH